MLSVQNLCKSFLVGGEKYPVLKGVSLEVKKGEFVGVMGPSGSGKSTLLNCISCYIPSDSGKILLGNLELSQLKEEQLARVRNEKLGFVFQDFYLMDSLTVKENGEIVLLNEDGGEEPTRETLPDLPQRMYWPQLTQVLKQEGLSADTDERGLLISW